LKRENRKRVLLLKVLRTLEEIFKLGNEQMKEARERFRV